MWFAAMTRHELRVQLSKAEAERVQPMLVAASV